MALALLLIALIGCASQAFGAGLTLTGNQTINLTGDVTYDFIALGNNNDLTFTGTGNVTVTGAISGNGNSDITWDSTGMMTVAATSTMTGNVSVSQGTLNILGDFSSTGTINVGSSGLLAGTGTVRNIVGGVISPGNPLAAPDTIGTLTATGNVDINLGHLILEIAGFNPGEYDSLVVGGQLRITGNSQLTIDVSKLDAGEYDHPEAVAIIDARTRAGTTFKDDKITLTGAAEGEIELEYNADHSIDLQFVGILPVTVAKFDAQREGEGVLLQWSVVSEINNAGFHVWRKPAGETREAPAPGVDPADEGWTQLNHLLVPGRVTSASPHTYAWYDVPEAGRWAYLVQSAATYGKREVSGHAAVNVDPSEPAAPVSDRAVQACFDQMEAAFAIWRNDWIRDRQDAPARVSPYAGAPRLYGAAPNPQPRLSSYRVIDAAQPASLVNHGAGNRGKFGGKSGSPQAAAKVCVQGEGLLRVSNGDLPDGYDVSQVAVTREGRPYKALGFDGDDLLFYAPGYEDRYTDTDALFFFAKNSGKTPANRVPKTAKNLFGGAAQTTGPATAKAVFDDVYFDFGLPPFNNQPWFSDQYLEGGTTQTFTVETPLAVDGAGGVVTVLVWSLSGNTQVPFDHALQVIINDTPLHGAPGATWSGSGFLQTVQVDIPAGVLLDGSNTVDLVTAAIDGVDDQLAFVYSIQIDYTADLAGPGDVTVVSAETDLYEISGLASETAWVVDITNPDKPKLMSFATQADGGGGFDLRFKGRGGGVYRVFPAGTEISPSAVKVAQLERLPKGVEYLAVGPATFEESLAPLLTARQQQGLNALFVDQERLFDTYGFGRYGPQAIQTAVGDARPQFLLLVGKSTYDYKNQSGNGVDPLCPTFLISTLSFGETSSDMLLGLGRGNKAATAVGRFPVRTTGELDGIVARTLDHTGSVQSGSLTGLMVADRTDQPAGDFPALGDEVVDATANLVTWSKAYLGETHTTADEVHTAMLNAADAGADVLFYLGHGSSRQLSNELILNVAKAQTWTGGSAVFYQGTCTANYFIHNDASVVTIAQQLLTQGQGGISASVASTSYSTAEANADFGRRLLENADRATTWGEALLLTQNEQSKSARKASKKTPRAAASMADTAQTQCLLGDPALPVRAP